MGYEKESEIFAQEVDFDEIRGIKKVFQPGMLDLNYFFNPESLKSSLYELCGYGEKNIEVYFRGIENIGIESNKLREDRKWWQLFQDFSQMITSFPAGSELEYWYGPSGREHSSPDFKENNPPYQSFLKLFNGAITGFSCFVNQNPNKIEFHSRTNISSWTGTTTDFLRSATILYNAFREMERIGYQVGIESMSGIRRREVRIISPQRGALVASLFGRDSITLMIENDSLRKTTSRYACTPGIK